MVNHALYTFTYCVDPTLNQVEGEPIALNFKGVCYFVICFNCRDGWNTPPNLVE